MSDPEQLSPYQLLLRQSRKMGEAASRSYDLTRNFLQQDVSALAPKALRTPRSDTRAAPQRDTLRQSHRKLNKIVAHSHDILAHAKTVILPTNLFPDTVVVDRNKVTIKRQTFFWSSEVISIRIEDILNIAVALGPLFGSITISSRVMNSTDHYEIDYFWRRDAIHLKHIIQGYMIAVHNDIDTSHMDKDELIASLTELGHEPNA